MHAEVLEYVARFATGQRIAVLDIGGRDLNGTPRSLFPHANYAVLDLRPGHNVDFVADAADWAPGERHRRWDLIVCTEVFEHAARWRDICRTARQVCRPGGRFVVTCAGEGRAPHSGIEATAIQPDEHYANLTVRELERALSAAGWADVEVEQVGLDLHATAVRA